MLKGHSVIELTDVNTGEVERYEDDNIVTNGLQYYSRYNGIPEATWENLFSGIRLFDSQLEENVETLFAPLSVETVGYASLEADTTNPKRGLFNKAESGRLDDLSGVKLVWDFAQSQANGTIACIGITPNEYLKLSSNSDVPANIEYRYKANISTGGRDRSGILDYDFVRGTVITYYSYKEQGTISIIKTYARFCNLSIIGESPNYKILEDTTLEISADFNSKCKTEAYFIGGDKNNYYFVTLKSTNTSIKPYRSSFLLIKIAKDNYTVTTEAFDFCEESYPEKYFEGSSKGNDLRSSFLMNGYIYLSNYKTGEFYKFKLSDLSFVKIINDTNLSRTAINRLPTLTRKDGTLFSGCSIDLDDNIHLERWLSSYSGSSASYGTRLFSVLDGRYALLLNYSSIDVYESTMLFTVNNLSSPVTKTADKTMKITYILKEVYPETTP